MDGGYYGGYAGTTENTPGSGGSGYVSNKLTEAQTIAGNASFTTTSGSGTETGHSGNGYAKITPVSVTGPSSTTTSKK